MAALPRCLTGLLVVCLGFILVRNADGDEVVTCDKRTDVDDLTQKLDVIIDLLRSQTEINSRIETSVVSGNRELKQVNDDVLKQLKLMTEHLQSNTEEVKSLSAEVDTSAERIKSLVTQLSQNNNKQQPQLEEMMKTLSNTVQKTASLLEQTINRLSSDVTTVTSGSQKTVLDTGAPTTATSESAERSDTSTATSDAMLLVGNAVDVRQINARTGQQHVVCDSYLRGVVAVDFDNVNNAVFWSDEIAKNITRAVLDSTGNLLLRQSVVTFDVLVPDGLAYDWVHQNLYWTDTGIDRIEVLSLRNVQWINYEGYYHEILRRTTLISTYLDEPKGIVVDPRSRQRMLYWSDCGREAKIERASLDGAERKLLVSENIVSPIGLTIDLTTDHLFWVDGHLSSIFSSNLEGQDRLLVLESQNRLVHPFSIDVFEGECNQL